MPTKVFVAKLQGEYCLGVHAYSPFTLFMLSSFTACICRLILMQNLETWSEGELKVEEGKEEEKPQKKNGFSYSSS